MVAKRLWMNLESVDRAEKPVKLLANHRDGLKENQPRILFL